jgi:DNA polymerase I-like protein with 3'-5' exonuclease and polymerase domains
MTDGMLRIQKRYPCVLTVHDEVVALVPEAEAEEAEAWVLAQMVKEPPYMPGIPLAAETGVAQRYGDAK